MNDKILIVDDEVEILNSLKTFMEFHGFETEIAQSAKEALNLMETQKFTIALLDINMPGMNGFSFIDGIKKIPRKISIIVVTGYGDRKLLEELIKKGICGYLDKPMNAEMLRKKVAEIIYRRSIP